jgi:hypothetical protein
MKKGISTRTHLDNMAAMNGRNNTLYVLGMEDRGTGLDRLERGQVTEGFGSQ